ncbi:hypothetical protein SBA4_4450004 [Candidatus Sulfopaludibacter sp. SbA4]|nr:hypothetical protein SBA4_4450004 [Candidatus Sulfopaludibacter sp. SbA4]
MDIRKRRLYSLPFRRWTPPLEQ